MLRWDIEWRMTLLTVLLVPLMFALGLWQLDRADEKAAIAAQNLDRSLESPISLATAQTLPVEEMAFRQVRMTGRFEPDVVLLLDNQIRDGRYGHDVFGVFRDTLSDQMALLNRGWVPGDPARRQLPEIDVPGGELTVTASAYLPPGEPYLLAEERYTDLTWPVMIQTVNAPALWAALESTLSAQLYPLELRLTADSPAGFRRDWAPVNVSPQKHQGYAVQWFTMAAALLLLYIFRSSNLREVLFNRTEAQDASEISRRQEKN